MGAPVVRFEIVGGKGNQLQKFYGELFGWKIDSNNPMNYGMVDAGSPGGIHGGVGSRDSGNRVSVFVEVEDLDAALAQAEKLGGVPGGPKLAMFADPAGNVTGLLLRKRISE